ncbi:conserved hypothetical protein [metagenome]|uniref:Uncharacterized protein n=1 Tax=metagenome TaxID=256318 RepID=A0A2P2BXS6_9ZZZZ
MVACNKLMPGVASPLVPPLVTQVSPSTPGGRHASGLRCTQPQLRGSVTLMLRGGEGWDGGPALTFLLVAVAWTGWVTSVPAMARVLVTGMSGTGKTTVLDELSRRGAMTVDTDDDVVLLSAPLHVLVARVSRRTNNPYGQSPDGRRPGAELADDIEGLTTMPSPR